MNNPETLATIGHTRRRKTKHTTNTKQKYEQHGLHQKHAVFIVKCNLCQTFNCEVSVDIVCF